MKLTPLDIRHKEFKRGMRGYADVEVDEFLDEVADEFERLFKESLDTKERIESLEEKVAGYQRIEETLQKTLVTAQGSAEELKENTAREAQVVLHEAESKARQMVSEAQAEKQAIEQSLAKIRAAEQDCRSRFRQMLDGYLRHLDDPVSPSRPAVDDAAGPDLARHAEAIKEAIAREAPAAPRAAVAPEAPAVVDPPVTRQAEAAPLGSGSPGDTASLAPPPPASPAPAAPLRPGPGAMGRTAGEVPTPSSEGDDLLADVDSGVNENEFKW
jgi:cell division initiation protein